MLFWDHTRTNYIVFCVRTSRNLHFGFDFRATGFRISLIIAKFAGCNRE